MVGKAMMNVCMASALTIVKAKLISSTIQSRVPFLQFESLWTVICGMDIPFVNDTKTTHFWASKVQMKNKLEHEQNTLLNWQTTKCMVTVSIYYCLVNTVSMKSLSPKFSDQWSPINQEGKKQYDRDFLMLLQNDPLSKERPLNLPHLDIVKDKTISGGIPSKDCIPTLSLVKPFISRVNFVEPF